MSSLAEQQAELEKGQAKIKKFFAAVKKLLATEFLWILAIVLMGIPLGFTFKLLLETFASAEVLAAVDKFLRGSLNEDEAAKADIGELRFIGAYLISLAGIYFSRTVIGSIQTLVKKDKKS